MPARLCVFVFIILAGVTVRADEARQAHESLNGVLWVQTALEYKLAADQAYALATIRVQEALADKTWTAALEQDAGHEALPPAVILDVDETVLDNSPFEARIVKYNLEYNNALWAQWVEEAIADPVPGAKDFISFLIEKKVAVFFVTNRDLAGEAATERNLSKVLGIEVTKDRVLCKNERASWSSDKSSRRAFLAQNYRILLLIGDDFNDFAFLGKVSPAERLKMGRRYREYWGRKWIQLPNTLYGSWERALYDYDNSLSGREILQMKYDALDTREK